MPNINLNTDGQPVYEVDTLGRPIDDTSNTSGRAVVGNTASGTTDTGAPVKIGGQVGTTANGLTNRTAGQRQDLWLAANGALYLTGIGGGSDAVNNFNVLNLPTSGGGGSGPLNTAGFVFNGTTWDRARGNTNGTFIAANANFLETQTALAAGASATGGARGIGPESRFSFFTVDTFADQPGTLFVERSANGTTWYPANGTAGTAVAAGQSLQIKLPITSQFYRYRYVNGATAQTTFFLTSALSLN